MELTETYYPDLLRRLFTMQTEPKPLVFHEHTIYPMIAGKVLLITGQIQSVTSLLTPALEVVSHTIHLNEKGKWYFQPLVFKHVIPSPEDARLSLQVYDETTNPLRVALRLAIQRCCMVQHEMDISLNFAEEYNRYQHLLDP